MKKYSFTVKTEQNGYKIKDFLKEMRLSTEIILKVKMGNVYLNGSVVKNINDTLVVGDEVAFILPKDQTNPYVTPIKTNLEILFQDEYFLAVNKPKGVLTHSLKYNKTASLEQMVLGYFLPTDFTFRPINRLDKDTSGIVLIAKDEFSASLINQELKSGRIKKTYLAVTKNKPLSEHFIVEKPILKLPNTVKRICDEKGKYAKTEFTFIKKICDDKYLLEVLLHTGRTHQIRVHLQSENLALYGDDLYGEKEKTGYILHAKKLEFTHPFTNKKIIIESPLKI